MRADLALVGFGNVGRRFAHLLAQRRDGWRFDEEGIDAAQAATSLEDGTARNLSDGAEPGADASLEVIKRLGGSPADCKVLVETTTLDVQTGQPAIDYVRAALLNGCDVVTANKGPVAVA